MGCVSDGRRSADEANWEVVDTRNASYIYFLNPCAPLTPIASNAVLQPALNACKGLGAINGCQASTTAQAPKSIGTTSSFQLAGSYIQLRMSGGGNNSALCHGKYNRSTLIRFICGPAVVSFPTHMPSAVYLSIYVCVNHQSNLSNKQPIYLSIASAPLFLSCRARHLHE